MEELVRELVDARDSSRTCARERAERIAQEAVPGGLGTPGHHFLVAEEAGRSVGAVWLEPTEVRDDCGEPEVVVHALEVGEELRSRGYGRAIMGAAEQWARANGATSMTLEVHTRNLVAVGLYRSLGFVTTTETMRKRL